MRLFLAMCIISLLAACTSDNIYAPTDGRDSVVYIDDSGCVINMDQARIERGDTTLDYYNDYLFCIETHQQLYGDMSTTFDASPDALHH